MSTRELVFDIFAMDRASAVLSKVGTEADAMGAKVSGAGATIAKGLAWAGVAAGVLAVESVKMAGDFQSSITRLQTTAGEVPANLSLVSKGLLSMAGQVGFTAKQLADGMYFVESGGYHGAKGLEVLQAAAKGARIEGSDLTDTTKAVTAALNDFVGKNMTASEATNTLVAAVGHGMLTFQQMSAALPNVGAAGANANVSLSELTAAIATMTMHGTDAAKAGTYLRQMLIQLSAPTAKARTEMQGLGIDANKLGLTLMSGSGHGLADAIKMIDDGITNHLTPSGLVAVETFKKSAGSTTDFQKMLANLPPTMQTTVGALAHMVGGAKSMQGVLQIGGANLKTFEGNVAAVNAQVKRGGKEIDGWAAYQRTFNARVNEARGAFSAVMVTIGTALLPVFTQFAGVVAQFGVWLSSKGIPAFEAWVSAVGKKLQPVIKDLGNFVKGTLFPAVKDLAQKFLELGSWLLNTGVPAFTAVWGFVKKNSDVFGTLAYMIGGAVIAFKAIKLATAGWAFALKIAAAAQALLNLAMDANPIGIVIIAIAALAAGLIYAWQHSKTFRDFVTVAFKEVKDAAWDLWNNGIRPALRFIADLWLTIVGMFVNGAADAFGWIPGLGPKLKAAQKWFNDFKDNVNNALSDLPKSVDITVNATLKGTNFNLGQGVSAVSAGVGIAQARTGYRAAGGPVFAGDPYVVGEKGPELFIPHSSGTVIPAGPTKAMQANGQKATLHIENFYATPEQPPDLIAAGLAFRLRTA